MPSIHCATNVNESIGNLLDFFSAHSIKRSGERSVKFFKISRAPLNRLLNDAVIWSNTVK